MNYLRNVEIKIELVICLVLLCLGGVAGAVAGGMRIALFVVGIGSVFAVLHFLSSYYRYQKIAGLSEKLNRFLHGDDGVQIGGQKEGELAVLESEIAKLVLRLRNQTDLLRQDKIYLVNSIADISHQIRTPLTSINLLVSRLSASNLSEQNRKKLLVELDGLLVHIDWLIQSLLTISKLDAKTIVMKQKKVPVTGLISQAKEALEIPMELRGQTLMVTCEEGVSFIGDMKWTKEALLNILKNCMEHTPDQGMIRVEASETPLFTEIILRDNGEGFTKEDLPHLFERFYKGKNSSEKSVGIGLALARMIITEQNGSISAENDRAGGAKFVIRFYKTVV